MQSIGELARSAGCKVQTVRYYEDIGLLPPAPRTDGNQRRYPASHARRLRFILHSRELGFSIAEIRQLLTLADQPQEPCAEVNAIAAQHLDEVRQRIVRLQALETELARMLAFDCAGEVNHCHVIDVLADHALCYSEHPPLATDTRTHEPLQDRKRSPQGAHGT